MLCQLNFFIVTIDHVDILLVFIVFRWCRLFFIRHLTFFIQVFVFLRFFTLFQFNILLFVCVFWYYLWHILFRFIDIRRNRRFWKLLDKRRFVKFLFALWSFNIFIRLIRRKHVVTGNSAYFRQSFGTWLFSQFFFRLYNFIRFRRLGKVLLRHFWVWTFALFGTWLVNDWTSCVLCDLLNVTLLFLLFSVVIKVIVKIIFK